MHLAGIEIGGTKIQVALGTPDGKIIETKRYAVAQEQGATGIQRQILDGLRALREIHAFDAIGIGFGGPIDWKTGRVFKSHHIKGWDGFALADWLRSELGVPVVADNDANVAALAEATLGAGRGKNPVFYMTVGSGIGGGIVCDGKIYHGQHPGEVEIGHTRVPFRDLPLADWPILEKLCSGWALDAQVRAAAKAHPRSTLAELVRGADANGEARFLLEGRQRGDPRAAQIWDDWTRHFALGLSHTVHLFHPQILIIGGGVSQFGQPLLESVREHLEVLVMSAHRGTYEIALARLGEQVVPTGALLLAGEK
jgi:glucokinase